MRSQCDPSRFGESPAHDRVACHDHVAVGFLRPHSLPIVRPVLPQRLPVIRLAPVRYGFQIRDESCQLLMPIVQRRGGSNDQEWSPDIVRLGKVC